MGIKITGYSDDLIEIDGDIKEEFEAFDDRNYLAASDGSILSIEYDNDGIWRIYRLIAGTAAFRKMDGNILEDTFDIVFLENEDIKWILFGKSLYVVKENL